MAFAKGRTNCEAERDTIVRGFTDLLKVLKQAKKQKETRIKAELYDIINDTTLSDEERQTQMNPFHGLMREQEETDLRIRRTILIGLFSFWELSIKDICDYYKLNIATVKCDKPKIKNNKPKENNRYSENDYLNAIFHSDRPEKVGLISSAIKQLRNYMTHGTANYDRMTIINNLMVTHPEFCISKIQNDYFITSYEGLENILNTIQDGLLYVETSAKTSQKHTNQ